MKQKKIIAIMQPTYMPWLGYFSMIDSADEFVFLDSVQLEGRSWQVRNKILYGGVEKLLTIPICKDKLRDARFICNTLYSGTEWKAKHLELICNAYKKALYFKDVMSFLESLYSSDYASIGEMNEKFITSICDRIGLTKPFFYSHEMNVAGHKDLLLVNICKIRNAGAYLSAQGSSLYIEAGTPAGAFGPNEIELYYQNYEHPKYKQLGKDFVPYIGVYDLLFNEGFESALQIIRSGQRESIPSPVFREKYLKMYKGYQSSFITLT